MNASFLKSKIRALRKYDLIKALVDILLPDITELGDFEPGMPYRRGDRVLYYDNNKEKSMILQARQDIDASSTIDLSQWDAISGSSSEVTKNLIVNENNNLMYGDSILNNVHVGEAEPVVLNEHDMWFQIGVTTAPPNGGVSPLSENELVIKNMTVQDDEPQNKDYLWGDLD